MSEGDWKARLAEARTKAIFEPMPTGTTPYAHRLEYLVERLDALEVTRAASRPDSPTYAVTTAVIILLRESINARMYAENLRARMDCEPDNVERLCGLVEKMLERQR
jgi:hypothetical protein